MAIYISKQSGSWSAASTWLTALPAATFSTNAAMSAQADAGAAPQSGGGDKIIIRGAGTVVEYDTNGMFGDGTSTFSTQIDSDVRLLSNAIVLSGGTLKGSRTLSTSLTANGTIVINYFDTAWFDWGTTSDPILAASSTIVFGSPTDATSLKCGIYTRNSTVADYTGSGRLESNRVTIVGDTKTRNTRLDGFHSTGTSTLTVLDCTNWQVNDRIVVEVPILQTSQPANTVGSITNINGKVVTINTTLNRDCPSGTYVGNFSSNVTLRPGMSAITTPGTNSNAFGIQINTSGNNSLYELKNFSMNDFSGTYGGGACINFGTTYARRNVEIENVSFFGTGNLIYGFNWAGGSGFQHTIKNVAYYGTNGNSYVFATGLAAVVSFTDIVGYRCGYIGNSVNSSEVNINNLRGYANITAFGSQYYPFKVNFNNCYIRIGAPGTPYIFAASYYNQKITINNSYFQGLNSSGGPSVFVGTSESSTGIYETRNCTFSSISLPVGNLTSSKAFALNYYSLNQNPLDNRRYNSWYALSGNYSMRNRGIASYELVSLKQNTQHYFTETIAAKANVSQRFVGYLRYQVSYGVATYPYITFTDDNNTPSVTQTFTCQQLPDTWQKFDLTVTPVTDGNLTMTVYTQTSSTTARIYLDGLSFDPINPKSRHYGFQFNETFPNQTINTLTTLTENEVATLATTLNLDHLYDAASYWSVSNPGATSYTDLLTANGSLLDFGNKNFIINNTGSGFSYDSGTNTITLNSPVLSAGNNFDTIKTTGTITLNTGKISYIDVDANIVQDTPTSLSGVYVLNSAKTYTYNTNTATEVEFIDCNIYGLQNVGNAIVTVKKTGTTAITESDPDIVTYIPTLININLGTDPTNPAYVALYDSNSIRTYYSSTNGTLVLPASATGTWNYKVAKYGSEFVAGSFNVNQNTGGTIQINPSFVPDTFVTEFSSNVVAAYTNLDSTAKIHDYVSYIRTTSTGIDYGVLHDQSFGTLSFNHDLTLDATAASVFDYSGGVITLKSSAITDDIIYFVNGDFTQSNGNTISNGIKVRADNLNSEFYFASVDSLIFYPTENDKNNNTNPGITITNQTTIFRFLYGGYSSGVTLSGDAYIRVTVQGTTLLNTTPINQGSNTIDFGDTGNIQVILSNQKIMNQGIQKASKLIPHSTNI